MCVGCAFSEVDLTCKMKGKCVRGTFAHGMQMIIKQYFHVYTHLPDSCGLCYTSGQLLCKGSEPVEVYLYTVTNFTSLG